VWQPQFEIRLIIFVILRMYCEMQSAEILKIYIYISGAAEIAISGE